MQSAEILILVHALSSLFQKLRTKHTFVRDLYDSIPTAARRERATNTPNESMTATNSNSNSNSNDHGEWSKDFFGCAKNLQEIYPPNLPIPLEISA
eukprot:scaffold2410_cov165-Skeletonema_marinoi.AAC.1